jgi:hypothetical protein
VSKPDDQKQLSIRKVAIYALGSICIARGIVVAPLLFMHSELHSGFERSAATICLICAATIVWDYKFLQLKNTEQRP